MSVQKVTFKSFGVDLVGDLYLPEGFDESKKYQAIVSASPFPQVKDQIPATYGPEMAKSVKQLNPKGGTFIQQGLLPLTLLPFS